MTLTTFTANTKIKSAPVNANFAGLADGTEIAAGAIAFSKLAATAWSSFTPSTTGFSGTPTESGRYIQFGKLVVGVYAVTGTSNATTLTFTLPVAAQANDRYIGIAITDNSAATTTTGYFSFAAGSTTCTVKKDLADNAFTGSGTKAASGFFFYEAD